MKDTFIDGFSAVIGIDWADKKHDLCCFDCSTAEVAYSTIKSTPEAIHGWVESLLARYPDKPIAIACEQKKGAIINALFEYRDLTLFCIEPMTVAKYRKAFALSGAKDDPKDAHLLLDILIKHHDKISPVQRNSEQTRALAQLVEYRRKLVDDRKALTNRITAILKQYYPQVLDWFEEKDTSIFCDFLLKWPTLASAKKATKRTLMTFLHQHNSRYVETNEKRIKDIKASISLTQDRGVIDPNSLMVIQLVKQLKCLIESIEVMNKEIQVRFKQTEDYALFSNLPGAGQQMAPRLFVAFGEDRSRYEDASDVQKYAGIAPVIERSGQKMWVHWRYSCPKFLRQTFVEWAGLTIRYSYWAKAYFKQQISLGKSHNVAIRALAFKWIRILFRCWKNKTNYDEVTYLNALKKRNAPLLKYAVEC